MHYTNKNNLPAGIYEALIKDTYDGVKDEQDSISISALINPPLQRQLYIKHNASIVEDASDRLWSVFGSAVHSILGNISDSGRLKEHRLTQVVDGIKVNGQPDLFDIKNGVLEDYKVTSVWSLVFSGESGKVEWERQLNCYAWLLRKYSYTVNQMQIIAILRDWNKSNAQKDEDYPRSPIQIIQIKDWGFAEQERYVMERVALHKSARQVASGAGEVPICGEPDRWFKAGKFAVQEEGKAKATKLTDTKEEAEKFVSGMTEKARKNVTIIGRKGIDTKCANYCSVAKFCSYGKQYFNNL